MPLPAFLLLQTLLVALPAAGQSFGRWWWDGAVGLGQRRSENLRGGERLGKVDQQELRLSAALNGFLFHPALGEFRLGTDLLLTELDGQQRLDSDRTGFSIDLGLLPSGAYPLRLFYRRQAYDYSTPDVAEPPDLTRAPDTSTQLGGRLRLRRGPLKGTLVGFDSTVFDLVDPEASREVLERQYVDWSRPGGALRHHVRLEHKRRRFGVSDLEIEDLTVNADQHGDLGPVWGWQLSGVGILREIALPGDEQASVDDFRVRSRLFRPLRQDDQLDLSASVNLTRPGAGPSLESYSAAVFYRWRPMAGWEIAPFAQYGMSTSDGTELSNPRAGVSVSWSRSGFLDTLLTARAAHGVIDRRTPAESRSESQTAYSVIGSATHGGGRGFSQGVELEAGRNELRLSRDPIVGLPDLGLSGSGLGGEDLLRGRVTLGYRWDSRSLDMWTEWNRRTASGRFDPDELASEMLTGTLQLSGRRFTLQANVGETGVESGILGDQEIRFLGASGSWRPFRALSLTASFRQDRRDVLLAPVVDGQRLQVGLRLRVGQLVLEGNAFRSEESLSAFADRENQGFYWSISRRFTGWLPIVTGTRQRGVIR